MRTSNAIERVNQELKRRKRLCTLPGRSLSSAPRLSPALRAERRVEHRQNLPQHEPRSTTPNLIANFTELKLCSPKASAVCQGKGEKAVSLLMLLVALQRNA